MQQESHRFSRRAFLTALFVVGFVLRWIFADGDFVGDDAWYLYLARSFGTEAAVQHERPWFHLLNRPVFYAFYHLSTYFGLAGFRFAGCVVGACVPLLSYRAAQTLGASPLSAAIAASFLALQRQQLEYSAYVFPDVLAAAFALLAIGAQGRSGRVLLWSLLCVGSKESFVCVPAIALGVDLLERRSLRLTLAQWLTLVLPVSYVVTLTLIGLSVPGLQMQGWSNTPLDLRHLRTMWTGVEMWPWVAWVALRRRARIVLLWLGLPVFYLIWSRVLGRGIAPWYAVGPCALASVAVALTLDDLRAFAQERQLSRRAVCGLLGLLIACSAPLPVVGLLHTRAQLRKLDGLPWPRGAPEVQAIIRARKPSQVLLVNCFWAYRYSHLRGEAPAIGVWRFGPNDDAQLHERLAQAQFAVFCRAPGYEALEAEVRRALPEPLFEDARYLVLMREAGP